MTEAILGRSLLGLRVLLVDDEPQILRALERCFATIDCDLVLANSGSEALTKMAAAPADIVISDMRMPGMTGDQLLADIAHHYPDSLRFILTGHADVGSVMNAINYGRIWGYLEKPWHNKQLIVSIEQALFAKKILAERTLLRNSLSRYQYQPRPQFAGFIGTSVAMQFVYKSIEYCAPTRAAVFISGASGSGKEVAAQAIHQHSLRAQKPLVALNCAAIPRDLMESEIFGHVRGAFSGAVSHREGAASQANGGTLFFDEIGEMDIGLQAKLLRFIQTGCYQKVGSDKIEKADIRFVSATNRDPIEAVANGLLREDLYYRLNVIALHLPALSERENDVLQIAEHWLKFYGDEEAKIFTGLDAEAKKLLRHYAWPGNVRQLKNTLHSCVVLSNGPLLTAAALIYSLKLTPQDVAQLYAEGGAPTLAPLDSPVSPEEPPSSITAGVILPLAERERLHIERAIELHAGNVVKAATALGVSPSTLYRKIQGWQTPAH